MYETILLPTDGSDGTADALRHALDLADRHGATVHALYVVDRRPYLMADDDVQAQVLESLYDQGEAAVEAVEAAAADAGIDVVTAVREGIPDKDILRYADEVGLDVIVMGTHGRTGRDKLATLGSVTERVVKNASVPVLVVHVDGE